MAWRFHFRARRLEGEARSARTTLFSQPFRRRVSFEHSTKERGHPRFICKFCVTGRIRLLSCGADALVPIATQKTTHRSLRYIVSSGASHSGLPGILMRRPFQSPLLPNFNHLHPDCFVRFSVLVSSSVWLRRAASRLASISLCWMPPQVSHLFCFVGLPLPTSRYVPLRVHLHREWINPGLPCYINST